MRPFRPALAVLAVTVVMTVTACVRETSVTTTSSTTTTIPTTTTLPEPETPPYRIGMVGTITTDNWWAALDTANSPFNEAYLTNSKTSLFSLSLPGFVAIPQMAATPTPVRPSQVGETWVVEQPIRGDVTWSDGEPVTADDLVFYFEAVRRLGLGGSHASAFPSIVTEVSAPNPHTVRVEFSSQPGLAVWENGLAFVPFVPAHFWEDHVDDAAAASRTATEGETPDQALNAILEERNNDDNPDNDLETSDVTQAMIDQHIANLGLTAARGVLYSVSGVGEPSSGALVVDSVGNGIATTTPNPVFTDRDTEYTLFSDGSLRVANAIRGTDVVYGGDGAGGVVAHYVQGPHVKETTWTGYEDTETAYESLAAGEVDFVLDPTGLTPGVRDQLNADSDLMFSASAAEGFRFMAFNMRKAPLSDLAFRQATATVIDKEYVSETILEGGVVPAYTVVHPDLIRHYNPSVERPGWVDGEPMDQGARFEAAIQILRDAGYTWRREPVVVRDDGGVFVEVEPKGQGLTMPNGERVQDLVVVTPGPDYDPFRATFSAQIETWMQDLGIPVVAEETDFDTIVDMTFPPQTPETALEWDMVVLGWGASDPALPGTSLRAFFHSDQDAVTGGGFNIGGYQSDEFDAVADAFVAATTTEEAASLTREMDAIVARDLPYVTLFRITVYEAFSNDVTFPAPAIIGGHQGYPNGWPASVIVAG